MSPKSALKSPQAPLFGRTARMGVSREERPKHAEDWVGRQAVWTIKLRRTTMTALVNIVDAKEQFGRIDCLIRTNTGDQSWVQSHNLKLVPRQS